LQLQNNISARVIAIHGGMGLTRKLERLGIRVGGEIIKIDQTPGPVIVKVGRAHLAIGRGMAAKILVEAE